MKSKELQNKRRKIQDHRKDESENVKQKKEVKKDELQQLEIPIPPEKMESKGK